MARDGMVDLYNKAAPATPVEMWPVDAGHALSFPEWKKEPWKDAELKALEKQEAKAVKAAPAAADAPADPAK